MDARIKRVNLSPRQRAEMLDELRWSNDFLWEDIEILAKFLDVVKIEKGVTLFEQGDREMFMCLVKQGEVDVFKEDSHQKNRVLAKIGREKTLGEMALIDGQARSATAITATETVMFILNQENFNKMADEHPKVWGTLLLKICKLMSQRLRATSGELVDFLRH